jgi:hypothetical protein
MPQLGYSKYESKAKDLGFETYTSKQLPYGFIYKGAWKGTISAASGWWQIPSPVSGHYVASGRQMKILFLRFHTEDSSGTEFAIVQRHGPANATARGVTNGTIDYPYLEGAGAEVLTGSMEAPIHVMEGSIYFYVNTGTQATEFSVSWWGCEAPPTEG